MCVLENVLNDNCGKRMLNVENSVEYVESFRRFFFRFKQAFYSAGFSVFFVFLQAVKKTVLPAQFFIHPVCKEG